MRQKLLIVIVVLGSMFGGCTTDSYMSTYRTLSITKETAIFVAKTAKELHSNKIIDDIQLSRVREGYESLQKSQQLFIDAQKEAIDAGDLESSDKVKALSGVYLRTMTKFVNLALEIGILQRDDERIQ